LPALVAAGFVKYAAFAITPFALLFVLRRHGWKAAAKTLGLSTLVGAVVSLPYIWELPGFKLQQVLDQFTDSTGSLHTFVTFSYRAIARFLFSGPVELSTFSSIAKFVLWGCVAVFSFYQFRRAWLSRRTRTDRS